MLDNSSQPPSPTAAAGDENPDELRRWRSDPTTAVLDDVPAFRAPSADCARLLAGDATEHRRAAAVTRSPTPDADIRHFAADCRHFLVDRRYLRRPVSAEEAAFPLAYTFVMYRDVEQFERLLRAVYRPQNVYCVHVDAKAKASVFKSASAVVGCFENVFLARRRFDVGWCHRTVLEADLGCMADLLDFDRKWKYVINLTGQEWPLKTNWELAKILKLFNGSNNIEGTIKGFDDVYEFSFSSCLCNFM